MSHSLSACFVDALTLLAFCYFATPSVKLQVMQIALVAPECA